MTVLATLLGGRSCVVLDGGLATELHHMGIAMRPPRWGAQALLSRAGRAAVQRAHAAFLAAGADVITANTFRTNLRALRTVGGDEAAAERLTTVAVALANRAAAEHGNGRSVVAASVAPVEDCYDPSGVPDDRTLEFEHTFFASILARLGVKVALIETMNNIREAEIAARATHRHGMTPWVSFVCAPGGRLLSGESVLAAASAVAQAGAEAVLVNCSDLAITRQTLVALRASELPLGVYPNLEDRSEAEALNDSPLPLSLGPGAFATELTELTRDFSLSLAGGCCGARPAHIRQLAASIQPITEGVLR